jgi:hypothetical protein
METPESFRNIITVIPYAGNFWYSSCSSIYIQNKKTKMITIQELLSTSSVAGDRLTINANFLLIENEINDLEDTFNINTVTGAMDISTASSGQLKAKTGYFNSILLPSTGTPSVSIYGTGASAGNASFSGTVSTLNLASSGTGTFNNFSATGPSAFSGDVTVSAVLTSQDEFQNGPTGFFTDKNTKSASGTSPFATVASGGGGITGTYTTPYQVTGTESVIYANCSYVSGAPGDSSNATGFFIQASSASGGATSGIPAGFKLTIINTGATGGKIGTGITGPATGTYYYTGFSTTNGSYSGTGIVLPSGYPYKSALTLMWEPRIGGGSATQKGSWVVLSSSNITSY